MEVIAITIFVLSKYFHLAKCFSKMFILAPVFEPWYPAFALQILLIFIMAHWELEAEHMWMTPSGGFPKLALCILISNLYLYFSTRYFFYPLEPTDSVFFLLLPSFKSFKKWRSLIFKREIFFCRKIPRSKLLC